LPAFFLPVFVYVVQELTFYGFGEVIEKICRFAFLFVFRSSFNPCHVSSAVYKPELQSAYLSAKQGRMRKSEIRIEEIMDFIFIITPHIC
jgi:hypothetical protein